MRISELLREMVEPGEAAIFDWPAAGTWAAGQVFRRAAPSMAWTLDGMVTPTGAITPEASALLTNGPGVTSDAGRLVIPWPVIAAWTATTATPESMFVAAYGENGELVDGVAFVLPMPKQGDLASIIARDEIYLGALVAARTAATETAGMMEVELPDGRRERYKSPAALSALIDQMDARLAILRARAKGHQFVGARYR